MDELARVITRIVCTLCETMLDLEAELAPPGAPPDGPACCVQFAGAWSGGVLLRCDSGLAHACAAILLADDACDDAAVRDALGELTNIVAGNLKAVLPAPSHLSLPAVVSSGLPAAGAAALGRTYIFAYRPDIAWRSRCGATLCRALTLQIADRRPISQDEPRARFARDPLMATPILVVDDSAVSRTITIRSLPRDWEVTITQAGNGKEALIALQQLSHALVLLDLNMPVMDGYEFLKVVNHWSLPKPIVIVLTGDIQPEAQARVKQLGARAFVKKPVQPLNLLGALKECGVL